MELINIGKRYGREWIFREINLEINPGEKVALIGNNGAGKSTLLQIIGGYTLPTQGVVKRESFNELQVGFAAPYQQLIEELTLTEQLVFHSQFKQPLISFTEMLANANLTNAAQKTIESCSSGMKQRLRLCLAFFFEATILLLDEPTSNLDKSGIDWYQELLNKEKRMVIIASNQPEEYLPCKKLIDINIYKNAQ